MAINYAWDVSTVDTYPTKDSNSDVVYNVHWRLTATDDTNKDSDGEYWTAGVYGSQQLDTDSISSFVAFGSLDAAKVQSWVEAALTSDTVLPLASVPVIVKLTPEIFPVEVKVTVDAMLEPSLTAVPVRFRSPAPPKV